MISGIILAAGEAKRMGQPKQLLLLDGKPLVWWVATAACQAELDEVMVVTGAYATEVEEALTGLPVRLVHNPSWADGQSGSVITAVQAVAAETAALVFLLADQPLVEAALINALVDGYRRTGAKIVAPYWRDRRGNPVLFELKTWRSDLLALTGDAGARQILAENAAAIQPVALAGPDLFFDVDTPADYQRLCELWRKRKIDGKE